MKATKTTYWTTTIIVSVMMIYSGYGYLTNPMFKGAFAHLGFSDAFRIELGIAKITGAILLLAPVGKRIKEWVYAGFGITFISAFIMHLSAGDAMNHAVAPIIFLIVLVVSYITYHRYRETQTIKQLSYK